jgi:uncharacterized membrane protein
MSGMLLAENSRTIYQWLRLEQWEQGWQWAVVAACCVAIVGFVMFLYRRDSVEQFKPVGWTLTLLRIAALTGLLLFFMQLEKSSEQRVVRDSRVAILLDSSLSMTLAGTPSVSGIANPRTRSEEVIDLLQNSSLVDELSQAHELSIYRFGQTAQPTLISAVAKQADSVDETAFEQPNDVLQPPFETARWWTLIALGIVLAGLIPWTTALGAQVLGYKEWYPGAWLLFSGATLILGGLITTAFATLPPTHHALDALLTGNPSLAVEDTPDLAENAVQETVTDWSQALAPRGTETRLGDAIKSILDREGSNPLAGIVVFSDGRGNAGLSPRNVLPLAQSERIPIYTVGLGSALRPKNVELVEIDVPKRMYPGDRFTLKALISGTGFEGQTVTVQILSGTPDSPVETLAIESEEQCTLAEDGVASQIDFQLSPKSVGEWQYYARILPIPGERQSDDNFKSTTVKVIERKNRILIVAGGPTREYQFVRNLLYRDRDVESHVLLQSGSRRSSQEAQSLVDEFPRDLNELSQYDGILAFDVDWTSIPESSVQNLERWVAEQAGGFLMVAGSVEMPKWLSRSASSIRAESLQALSPVVLDRRGSALTSSGRIEGETAWPLDLTVDGRAAEFLWVTDEYASSLNLWEDFEGVYSYYSAYELKPAAKALLMFTDPTAANDGQAPIYMANQYYGAGRTMFLAGGELWRLRELGDEYFDRLYTKVVRWISQGRLLLDSDRGVLLVDREKALLGDQITLRAVLKNERFEPLVQPEVVARLIDPQGLNTPIVLRPLPDGSQPGVYTGGFSVLKPGEYTAQLQLGGLASDEVLSSTVLAKVPALEMQRAERDDQLLRQLAVESGGRYWIGTKDLQSDSQNTNDSQPPGLVQTLVPQDQVAYLPGTIDQEFQLRWHGWLMIWIASCLSMEWLARRLHRLA